MRPWKAATGTGSLSETLARSPNMQLPWIGYRIFKWLLLLITTLLLLLVVYAWRTYPDATAVDDLLVAGATPPERLAVLEALRSSWLTSVKDLGQMFVLTPVIPLLGAVVGYIFGVSRQLSASEQALDTAAEGPAGAGRAPVTPVTTSATDTR